MGDNPTESNREGSRQPRDAHKAPERVQGMFAQIAPVYDLLNHLLSLNIDRLWRSFTVRSALRATDRRVLDLACGTGDLTLELAKRSSQACQVVGADFCLPMLRCARGKSAPPLFLADGLRLPFREEAFDLVTIGFGLRNMEDYRAGLREMHRVLAPGGRLAVLEFTTPTNRLFRAGYFLYFDHVLPMIGKVVSGGDAYRYLNETVRQWPDARTLAREMRRCGFHRVRHAELSFGIAALHIAERGEESSR